ncbi:hypothetical protein [Dactylosporangium sp. NPDC005555]|uniref:hypothetical protein n=1 Tax=Dactylosporangium sp. NPDC005555 TaxID=3154889 RepID=UPI0033AE552A
MDIELEFIDQADGSARQRFTLDGTDRPVALPSPLLINRSGRHIVVQAVRVTPDTTTGTTPARQISDLWQPVLPLAGVDLPPYGRYLAPWQYVAGSALPPGQTAFTWSVDAAERLADGRLVPLGERLRRQCVLVTPSRIPDAPAPAAPEPPAAEPRPTMSDTDQRYKGWVAIDFGMSNSTITMFDQNQKRALLGIAPTQVARLRDCLTELLNGTATEDFGLSGDEWRDLLEGAGRTLAASTPGARLADPLTQLKESLAGDRVFDVLLALDQEVDNALPARRDALTGGLQRLYRDAFARPPIAELQFFPVPMHANTPAISSDARVLSLAPFELAMWDDGFDPTGRAVPVPVAVQHQPGLKRFVGNNRPLPGLPPDLPGAPTTDDALTAVWRCLLDRVSEFRRMNGDRYAAGEVHRAVVTYPTTAPPQTRLDMERLAHSVGLRFADTRLDEATAAAMFNLMRAFAGDPAIGVEAFRARSRQVAPETWQHNILVIDIGGGSTDVALLALTLRDHTERDGGVPVDQQGRYYELRPTVLGKAGNLQLGGDRITLGIFHLFKARIADLLLTRSPEIVVSEYPPFLEGGVYRAGSVLPVAGAEDTSATEPTRLALIDQVVPTRWSAVRTAAEEEQARERFLRLWNEADKAKRASAAGRPYLLRNLQELLKLGAAGAHASTIEVDHAAIRAEIDHVLSRAMEIALDVACKRLLAARGGTEPLDMVILSGGTTALPRARQLLQEIFTGESAHSGWGTLRWNPLHVVHDPAFAKVGTSIGACWTEHVRQKGYADPRRAKRNVAMGRTELHIDVDNLLHGLPYDLELSGTGPNQLPVFPAGREFERVGESGQGAQRSEWMPAILDLAVNRSGVSKAEPAVLWGFLSLQELHDDEDEPDRFDLDEWVGQVSMQFEIDEADMLTVHFCAGSPHYSLDMSACPPDDQVAGRDTAFAPVRLRHDLVVNPDVAGGMANHGKILLREDSEPDGCVVSPGEQTALSCWVSVRFPREVPTDGTWWIGRRDPDDPTVLHRVGTPFRAAIRHGRGADTRIVVDETGRVQPVRGFVPYLPARSMADVIANPGRVLSVPMEPGKIDLDERFDPFNGSH